MPENYWYIDFLAGQAGLEPPQREFRFCERRWRFDLCWPDRKLAVEIEGGVWTRGRHTRGRGYVNDLAKYNEASLMGFTLLRVTPEQVEDGTLLALLMRAVARG